MYDGKNLPTSSREYPNVICVRSFVPKEKKSACAEISSARSAARGISIIVPTLYAISIPRSANTLLVTARTSVVCCLSSSTVPTSGIMISGTGSAPSRLASHAASMMARTCISAISGNVIAKRHPRKPNIGFTSASFSMHSAMSSSLSPVSSLKTWQTSSTPPSGRNSCNGGSSRRTVTGKPLMALKMPVKSSRWYGNKSSNADLRVGVSLAKIMRRTARMRSPVPKNMCSVRTKPMPSAPLARDAAASAGVSAFAKTRMVRNLSTHDMKVSRYSL
mmetsp:Transcript_1000/g.3684  ORF Transcript_1000/g.3684 Transcript_1000/m.3684 type:complete len:276 (+) Transcript_1000:454-1281(+)